MAAQMLDAERKRQQLIKQKEDVRTTLLSYEGQIKQALPGMIKPDRMIRVALTAINRQPKLFQCTLSSIVDWNRFASARMKNWLRPNGAYYFKDSYGKAARP